jgi:hypothetical protein
VTEPEEVEQSGWIESRAVLHHFRTHAGQEVDVVLEDARGRVVGIEVKASATVTGADLNGLRARSPRSRGRIRAGDRAPPGRGVDPVRPEPRACPLRELWETR